MLENDKPAMTSIEWRTRKYGKDRGEWGSGNDQGIDVTGELTPKCDQSFPLQVYDVATLAKDALSSMIEENEDGRNN